MLRIFIALVSASARSVFASDSALSSGPAVSDTTSLPGSLNASASLLEVTLNLGLVVAAIVVLTWVFKRFQGIDQNAVGQLKVTASLPLGPKERILVVEVGDEHIVVGATSAGINKLHVLSAPLQSPSHEQESFGDKLKRSLKGEQS